MVIGVRELVWGQGRLPWCLSCLLEKPGVQQARDGSQEQREGTCEGLQGSQDIWVEDGVGGRGQVGFGGWEQGSGSHEILGLGFILSSGRE